jgi:HEAT repeat protein
MGKTQSNHAISSLFTGISLLLLVACATTKNNQYFDSDTLPSQTEITAQLAKASFPRELREQIIRLYSRNALERAEAAYRLGKMNRGAAPAVPYLVKLLQDNTPVTLSHYLGGGYYNSSETTPGEEASHSLGLIGSPAVNSLLLALNDPHADVRRLAVKALGQIGELSSVNFLIDALNDPDRSVRATAAIALGMYRHPMAAQKIMEAYPAANASTRQDMVFALSHINDILSVPFLIENAKDPNPDVRAAIMLALGELRDGRAVPTLFTGLSDNDEVTRANAAYALGAYYSPAVIDVLIKQLADTSPRVQEAVAGSLSSLTGMNYGTDQNKWQSWWSEQRDKMTPAK